MQLLMDKSSSLLKYFQNEEVPFGVSPLLCTVHKLCEGVDVESHWQAWARREDRASMWLHVSQVLTFFGGLGLRCCSDVVGPARMHSSFWGLWTPADFQVGVSVHAGTGCLSVVLDPIWKASQGKKTCIGLTADSREWAITWGVEQSALSLGRRGRIQKRLV